MLKNIDTFLNYIKEKNITNKDINNVRLSFITMFTNDVLLKNEVDSDSLDKSFLSLFDNGKKYNNDEGVNIINQIKRFSYFLKILELEPALYANKKYLRKNIIPAALSGNAYDDNKWENNLFKDVLNLSIMTKDVSFYLRALPYQENHKANRELQKLVHQSKKNEFSYSLVKNILKKEVISLNLESVYEIGAWNLLKDRNDDDLIEKTIICYNKENNNYKKILEVLQIGTLTETSFKLITEISKHVENISEILVSSERGTSTFKDSISYKISQKENSFLELFVFLVQNEKKLLMNKINSITEKNSNNKSRRL